MTEQHLAQLGTFLLALHGLAIAVVNLTPSPRDNDALDRYQRALVTCYRLIECLAGIIGPLAKR